MTDTETIHRIQEAFLRQLPKMQRVLRFRLRGIPEERREEALAEGTAICWREYRKLCLAGRDPDPLISKIAEFASRGVRSEKLLTGQPSVNDVMSPTARF